MALRKSKVFLPETYFPAETENRMTFVGDVVRARARFFEQRPSNLVFLLQRRFEWMNFYLHGKETVIELGAGAGFSKEFITNTNLTLTDVSSYPWIKQHVDAVDLPYLPESVDAFVCNHMIHHLAQPKKFLQQAWTALKPGGYLVVSEVNTSLMLRLILRLMRHEGWSYATDVFSEEQAKLDPSNPWTANCAIPELLFSDEDKFLEQISGFRFLKNEVRECLILLLSGGVIAKTKTILLPMWALKIVAGVDRVLVRLFPRVFAMERLVVLQKIN